MSAAAARFWLAVIIILVVGFGVASRVDTGAKAPVPPATPSATVTGTPVGGHR